MNLTDKSAISALKRVNCCELTDLVYDYPEDERDGRTDWEMIANEAGYLLSMFREDDTAHSDGLREAREILHRTKGGKVMPINARTLKPLYKPYEIQTARDTVNEYNRLARFVKKLQSMGLYCPWC